MKAPGVSPGLLRLFLQEGEMVHARAPAFHVRNRCTNRRSTMVTRAFVLAAAFAMAAVALPSATSAAPDSHSGLAAPFSPKATIYRPDCWIKEDPLARWDATGSGCIRD